MYWWAEQTVTHWERLQGKSIENTKQGISLSPSPCHISLPTSCIYAQSQVRVLSFFSFLFSFSVLIVIQGSSIVITHQMLSRHFIVFFSFFSFTLFPPPQSESLYHPFWCFCFFLCGPLSILLFPPSVNAVIAVRGSIGRDGEKWKKHEEGGALLLVTSWIVWGGVGVCVCVGGEIVKGVVLLWQWDLLCVRLPRQLQAYTWYRHHHHPTPPPTPSATWLQGEHFTLCMRSLMHPHTGNA